MRNTNTNPFEPDETECEQNQRVGRMIRENVDKKIRDAAALVGRRVRFAHEPEDSIGHLVTLAHDGMVELDGWSGQFAPHLFVAVDSDDPRSR